MVHEGLVLYCIAVNLLCNKQVDDDMQSVVVSCTHDRELAEANCSINHSPPTPCMYTTYILIDGEYIILCVYCDFLIGTLPLRVDLTPSTREYTIQIAVADSLNLTDEYSLTHTGSRFTTHTQHIHTLATLIISFQLAHL